MINIVFCIDTKLGDKIYNCINSIKAWTKEQIQIYILTGRNFNSYYLAEYGQRGFKVITNVDIPEIKDFKRDKVKSKAMFFRWLIADKIPEIDRCIYLEPDCLLNADIKELWDIDLGDKMIGLVRSQFGDSIRKTIFYQGHVDETEAFINYDCDINNTNYNSGQAVIDLKKWRQKEITKKLIDFIIKYKTADQIALNVVCYNDIFQLDDTWCAPANCITDNFKAHPPCIHSDYKKCKLYHFHGMHKPWDNCYSQNKTLKSIWDKYNDSN